MATIKDQMIRIIQVNASKKAADLAGQFVRSKPEDKEAILAGLDFEQWLQQCCHECLDD
jgi:hypothetical protein